MFFAVIVSMPEERIFPRSAWPTSAERYTWDYTCIHLSALVVIKPSTGTHTQPQYGHKKHFRILTLVLSRFIARSRGPFWMISSARYLKSMMVSEAMMEHVFRWLVQWLLMTIKWYDIYTRSDDWVRCTSGLNWGHGDLYNHFYPRPVLAFGYCRCLRLSVWASIIFFSAR